MWGQWLGSYRVASDKEQQLGSAVLNIDRDTQYRGKLALYNSKQPTQSVWCDVYLEIDAPKKAHFVVPPSATRPVQLHGEMTFLERTDETISGTWILDDNSTGDFAFSLNISTTATPPDKKFRNWASFKKWLASQNVGTKIYRGQIDNRWRLKTSFHRSDRFDLIRYGQVEVQQLNRYLTGILDRTFDIKAPSEHGALLNLAQHHGFPTPLLDWTESPYIAAFFAYSDLPKRVSKGYVRLFMFDSAAWLAEHPQITDMYFAAPYLSIHQLLPLYNTRALPQQSVVTSTNISDIEGWLKTQETSQRRYLTKIDLPASERNAIMADLTSMGITAASLFPGIEGTCRALNERFF